MHGHEHQIMPKFGARGLTAIGFGAAYQAAASAAPKPYYRNSFAICELAEALHVSVISWDSENGRWTHERQLPPDFVDKSDRLTDGFRLSLQTTLLSEHLSHSRYGSVASAIRSDWSFGPSVWLVKGHVKRWSELLMSAGLLRSVEATFELPTQAQPVGHIEFRVKDRTGQHLVYAVSGHGDVLNYDQVQAINTELDTQNYDSVIIATLGDMSKEASTLAQQLASRKAITALDRNELTNLLAARLPTALDKALREASNEDLGIGSLVFTETGIALLIQEKSKTAWFEVFSETGDRLADDSALTSALRREIPTLRQTNYRRPSTNDQPSVTHSLESAFDKPTYLRMSAAHFDEVKYAPLAALGFRFKKASLTEFYVEPSADVGGTSRTSDNLNRSISDFVETFNLSRTQRDQLESQLRSRYGLNRTAEVGAARKLYQKFNNVLVLGDPGSGKTCFVQNEILAYCSGDDTEGWYARHLPVYVSLAEAARLLSDGTTLLDICSIVSVRRGISLPKETIETLLAEGGIAFFFDGLDEVGYLERRIALVSEISNLVEAFAARGNRFVIASRPAAIQPVEIPDALTHMQLKGLTEGEIKLLAGRVLKNRLSQDDDDQLTEEESELIDKLIEDTRNSPGIGRIARNPLLLTLLVLIYANSGAITARRHVIYSQAIRTLVSVRGRLTREQRISEADLRVRLGALALAIFKRDVAEIPKRSEVCELLSPLLPRRIQSDHLIESLSPADAFLQEVAEATGLISIHSKDEGKAEDLITFMHYSFLEYYTAAGLLSKDYSDLLPELASNPRWKDVTTLLFGILSEQGDVTPLVRKLLESEANIENVTGYRTLLALDCANECDVPPEATQEVICDAIYHLMAEGAGRHSVRLRADIVDRPEFRSHSRAV